MQSLFVSRFECNPIRHSIVQLTCRRDDSVPDPVVDDARADAELLGYLLNGELVRTLERCWWDLITPPDPPDNFCVISLTRGTGTTISVELSRNLGIRQPLSQLADSLHDGLRVAHAIGHIERKLYDAFATSSPLPADVNQELLGCS